MSLTVLLLPLARVRPSGLNATVVTVSVWQGAAPVLRGSRVGHAPQLHRLVLAAAGQSAPTNRHSLSACSVANGT
jgi:hypothetical protein